MPEADFRSPARAPSRLRRLDGRVKLLLLIASCFASQYLPEALLPVWLLALATLFRAREMRTPGVLSMLRGGAWFIAFWLAVKVAADVAWGGTWGTALAGGLPLGARLFALTLVGMAAVGFSSPVETGRAAAWFMRPFLGKRAWKPAAAVALTAWFLPLTLRLAGDVSLAVRARGVKLSWGKRALLTLGVGLRILDHKAREVAVALASRRFDDYRSWLPEAEGRRL